MTITALALTIPLIAFAAAPSSAASLAREPKAFVVPAVRGLHRRTSAPESRGFEDVTTSRGSARPVSITSST